MIRIIVTLAVTAVALAYSLAVYLTWPAIREDNPDWSRKRVTWYALGDGAGLVRDWVMDGLRWLFPRLWRGSRHGAQRANIHARSGRAAVNRWNADRRRPPVPESAGAARRPGAVTQPMAAPPRRSVVTPLRQEPANAAANRWHTLLARRADAPGPAANAPDPAKAAPPATGPASAGAIHPAFDALITWILDQEHPDSVDFEEFHRQLSSGFLAAGEALHGYTEHLAEGGIGLDPVIVQAAAEVAEATGELATGIVDIFRKFHAVYAGYLVWREEGHQMTHDGRWIRPESA